CTSAPLASSARTVAVSPLLTALLKGGGGGGSLLRVTKLQPARGTKRHRSMPTSCNRHVLSWHKVRNACAVIRILPLSSGTEHTLIAVCLLLHVANHRCKPSCSVVRSACASKYNPESPDIPLYTWRDMGPRWRSHEGKITALAIAFIVATKVREQLQEPLLL